MTAVTDRIKPDVYSKVDDDATVRAVHGLLGGHHRGEQPPIPKDGGCRVVAIAVQIAWIWVLYQRDSELTQWYMRRFSHGGPRARKVGIVAVARRLMIDLWRYLDAGVMPAGATLRPHQATRTGTPSRAA